MAGIYEKLQGKYYDLWYDRLVRKDIKSTVDAANNGDIDSQNALGDMYYEAGNPDKSYDWHRKAAVQGDEYGQECCLIIIAEVEEGSDREVSEGTEKPVVTEQKVEKPEFPEKKVQNPTKSRTSRINGRKGEEVRPLLADNGEETSKTSSKWAERLKSSPSRNK